MRDIVVVTAAGATTGGAELTHQLAHVLSAAGLPARLIYYPFNRAHASPPALGMYKVDPIQIADVPANAIVVLSEVSSYRIRNFPGRRIVFWWLSVDNYFRSRNLKYWLANGLPPWTYLDVTKAEQRSRIHCHLFQSEYARLFLETIEAPRVAPLGDYINDAFLDAGARVAIQQKEDLLIYNPAKGLEATRRLLAGPRDYQAIAISGMARAEVIALMARAKVYIDFGNHPGQDRIPREAAALGCCVVTNRRGSASNAVDIPIPDIYKISDVAPGFVGQARDLISDILAHFDHHHAQFAAYREMIAGQKTRFETAAVDIFSSLAAG